MAVSDKSRTLTWIQALADTRAGTGTACVPAIALVVHLYAHVYTLVIYNEPYLSLCLVMSQLSLPHYMWREEREVKCGN